MFGLDLRKWIITKPADEWHVYPPNGSFWGRHSSWDTFEEALADYRDQTGHFISEREKRRVKSGGRSR